MIIGHGTIASVLPDREDFVFMASGVSNSREDRDSEYNREEKLLHKTIFSYPNKKIVYFGSLSIFYADTRYTQHKKNMETILKHFANDYTIVRIGAPTWGDNPHTFINAYKERLKTQSIEELHFDDEYRYILELDEFLYWINLIPDWNCEMNITGKRMKIKDAVLTYGNS